MIWARGRSALVLSGGHRLFYFFLGQINTCASSEYLFYKRVSLSHLFSPKNVLVHSNAIINVELSEALLSSSCSHVVGALRWAQGRRVGELQDYRAGITLLLMSNLIVILKEKIIILRSPYGGLQWSL